jgi:hypothetical protein
VAAFATVRFRRGRYGTSTSPVWARSKIIREAPGKPGAFSAQARRQRAQTRSGSGSPLRCARYRRSLISRQALGLIGRALLIRNKAV